MDFYSHLLGQCYQTNDAILICSELNSQIRGLSDVIYDIDGITPRSCLFCLFVCLFVCFVALCPKSTAMVMAGRSVHITTLFSWASLNKRVTSNSCTYFRL